MFGYRRVEKTIVQLDTFLDKMDECILYYKNGIRDYLEGNSEQFQQNISNLEVLRNETTEIRRNIENELYHHSLMADRRAEILQLLEHLDLIISQLYKYLMQYDIEVPFFPSELAVDYLKLVELSSLAVSTIVEASKDYFRAPKMVNDKIHRIYYFEKEVSQLAQSIKRKVFHEMANFKLSQKIHLRYFTLHVEEIAEESMKTADLLSLMLIRQEI